MAEVGLMSLWLPIVLSALIVFIASSLVWMVVKWHDSDWSKLPDEEAARAALKGVGPGQYSIPHAASNSARQDPEWMEKCKEGPMGMLVMFPSGLPAMGKQLVQWMVYCLVISLLVAYVASATLAEGTAYLKVFQVAGTVAVLAYAGAAAQGAIWFGHTWSRTVKDIIDGVVYGLLSAGVFGWLWP